MGMLPMIQFNHGLEARATSCHLDMGSYSCP